MKGIFYWFKDSSKMKRWIMLILVGIVFSSFGMANMIVSEEAISFGQAAKIIAYFVIGFTCVVLGLVFINKRNMELFIEATDYRLDKDEKEAFYLGRLKFSPKTITEKEFLSYLDPNKPTYPPRGNPTLYSWEFTGSESELKTESSVLQRLLFGSFSISYTLYVSSHSPNISSMRDIKTMRFGVKWEYRTLLHTYFVGILSNANKGVQTCGKKW